MMIVILKFFTDNFFLKRSVTQTFIRKKILKFYSVHFWFINRPMLDFFLYKIPINKYSTKNYFNNIGRFI